LLTLDFIVSSAFLQHWQFRTKNSGLRNAGTEVPTSTGASTSRGCKKLTATPIAKVSAKPFTSLLPSQKSAQAIATVTLPSKMLEKAR